MIPSGLISTISGSTGARSTSAASLEKGSEERPWKDFDQSTRLGSDSLRVKVDAGGEIGGLGVKADSVDAAEAVEGLEGATAAWAKAGERL